jgi:hypothetical protein
MKPLLLTAVIGCLAFAGLPLQAADEKKDAAADSSVTLDQFKLGETIANDEVTMESLKGKVVAIEMWGIH